MTDDYTWRTSTLSAGNGDCVEVGWRRACSSANNCVEVHGGWRKSSYSSDSANCVEVAEGPETVAVRDSKNPDGGMLVFGEDVWSGFVADVRAGRYDL